MSVVPWFFLGLIIFIISALIWASVLPQSLAAQVTMEVYQQEGRKAFGQETSLDIFNDPKLDGQKLVHPFTKGSYTFAVCNNSDSDPLPYSLDINGTNPDEIPLVFSLQKSGEYIYGGEDKTAMIPLSEINLPEVNLDGNKTDIYTLKWEWETESDEIDTAIGNIGTQTFKLIITATGTIPTIDVLSPQTGNPSHMVLWFAIVILSMSLLFILLFHKRNKDEEKEEDNESITENI